MHTFQKHAWKIEKAVYCYNDVIAKTKQIPPAAHLLSSSKILSNQILQSKHKIFSSFKSLTIGEFLKHCMFKEKDTLFWIPWNLLKTSLCTKFPFLGSSHANFKKKKMNYTNNQKWPLLPLEGKASKKLQPVNCKSSGDRELHY